MADSEPSEDERAWLDGFAAGDWVPDEPALPMMPPRGDDQRGKAGLRQAAKEAGVLPPPPSLAWRMWQHFKLLCSKGIIFQVVGIPVRHLLGLYGAWLIARGQVGWRTCLLAFILWPVSGLGVTAGAHRLWAHQSYLASPLMELMLVIMFSMADQGSIQGWSLTHVMHHANSDTPQDPHNRCAGFWHAHFLWVFASKPFCISNADYQRTVSALGPFVRLHDSVSVLWDPLCSLGLPALIASCWGEAANGFFVAGALRWMCVQHITFFVNSVAHGELDPSNPRSFDAQAEGVGPRVSLTTTILALGEGWHDYHHLFPWDYAAAELGAWDQWNPTKVFIDVCFALGLASDRRRCSDRLQFARRRQLAGVADDACYTVTGPLFLRQRVPVGGSVKGAADGRSCKKSL